MKKDVVRNGSINYVLNCHGQQIKVTSRRSKQMERGRYHRCKECGQVYVVNARGGTVINAVPC